MDDVLQQIEQLEAERDALHIRAEALVEARDLIGERIAAVNKEAHDLDKRINDLYREAVKRKGQA